MLTLPLIRAKSGYVVPRTEVALWPSELHGGSLRLESEVGVGTTAAVILPRERLKAAEDGGDPAHREPPRRIAVASAKSLF